MKDLNNRLYLRRLIINLPASSPTRRQLRVSPADMTKLDIYTELDIDSVDETAMTVTLKISAQSSPTAFVTTGPEDNMIPAGSMLYLPVRDATTNAAKGLIDAPVMNYMTTTAYQGSPVVGKALHENYNETANQAQGRPIANPPSPPPKPPPDLPDAPIAGYAMPNPGFLLVGLYEGGARYAGGVYRPAGSCKMKNEHEGNPQSSFCYVCKYLIVSRINPSKLGALDGSYQKRS
jgi:IgA Peptidase M64